MYSGSTVLWAPGRIYVEMNFRINQWANICFYCSTVCYHIVCNILPTILVKNVAALDTDSAEFDPPPPPFRRTMLYAVYYTWKLLCNIDWEGRRGGGG